MKNAVLSFNSAISPAAIIGIITVNIFNLFLFIVISSFLCNKKIYFLKMRVLAFKALLYRNHITHKVLQ